MIDVGWVRHAVCAVTRQLCRQALIKKGVVLLRNAWWVTQKTLTHPTVLCAFAVENPGGIRWCCRHLGRRLRRRGRSGRIVAHPDDEVMADSTGRLDPDLVIERLLHQGARQRGIHADPAAGGVELVRAHDAIDPLHAVGVFQA